MDNKPLEQLSVDELCKLLLERGVSPRVVEAIQELKYGGQEFVDGDFLQDAFSDADLQKHSVKPLHLAALKRIRGEIMHPGQAVAAQQQQQPSAAAAAASSGAQQHQNHQQQHDQHHQHQSSSSAEQLPQIEPHQHPRTIPFGVDAPRTAVNIIGFDAETVTEEDFISVLEPTCGKIYNCDIVRKTESGRPAKYFAVVRFASYEAALKACEMTGDVRFGGKVVNIDLMENDYSCRKCGLWHSYPGLPEICRLVKGKGAHYRFGGDEEVNKLREADRIAMRGGASGDSCNNSFGGGAVAGGGGAHTWGGIPLDAATNNNNNNTNNNSSRGGGRGGNNNNRNDDDDDSYSSRSGSSYSSYSSRSSDYSDYSDDDDGDRARSYSGGSAAGSDRNKNKNNNNNGDGDGEESPWVAIISTPSQDRLTKDKFLQLITSKCGKISAYSYNVNSVSYVRFTRRSAYESALSKQLNGVVVPSAGDFVFRTEPARAPPTRFDTDTGHLFGKRDGHGGPSGGGGGGGHKASGRRRQRSRSPGGEDKHRSGRAGGRGGGGRSGGRRTGGGGGGATARDW